MGSDKSSEELLNYVLLCELVESSQLEIAKPNLTSQFFDFCQEHGLLSFVYSTFATGDFEQVFPAGIAAQAKNDYERKWAANLRLDTIRYELCTQLAKANTQFLFIDSSLRSRLIYGHKFFRSDDIIHLLIRGSTSLAVALNTVYQLGFREINPAKNLLGKLIRKSIPAPCSYFFRRNEFTIRLCPNLPTILGDSLDSDLLWCDREAITLSNQDYEILSEQDELFYRVLCLYDSLVLGSSYVHELIDVLMLLYSAKLPIQKISIRSGKKSLENVLNQTILLLPDICKAHSKASEKTPLLVYQKQMSPPTPIWKNIIHKKLDKIGRVKFFLKTTPEKSRLLDLAQILFGVDRYLR